MAYCVVNGVQYGAVANAQLGLKGQDQLMKDVAQNVDLSPMPDLTYQTIVFDLICENYEFSDWKAIAREIEIRRVGYAVEATMRSMYELNKGRDEKYQETAVALAKQKRQLVAGQEDPNTAISKDNYRASLKAIEEDAAKNDLSDKDILRWDPPTFPSYSYRDKQVMEWWLGLRKDDPKLANCWECVLMALVNTRSLNASTGYMIWAIEQVVTNVFKDFNPNDASTARVSRLYSHAAKNMDYYFPNHECPVLDAKKERLRPAENANYCFNLPVTQVIPRGRLLIFEYMTHVGISTGTLEPITNEMARAVWGRNVGHGIIDLNAKGQTIRARTIEDFVTKGNCNTFLMVAPFPICNEKGSIAIKGAQPPTPEEIEAYRRDLDKAASEAYDAKVKELEAARKKALESGKNAKQADNNLKNGMTAAKMKFENAVVKAAKEADKKVKELAQVKPASRQENFTLEYAPFDPYNGKVTF